MHQLPKLNIVTCLEHSSRKQKIPHLWQKYSQRCSTNQHHGSDMMRENWVHLVNVGLIWIDSLFRNHRNLFLYACEVWPTSCTLFLTSCKQWLIPWGHEFESHHGFFLFLLINTTHISFPYDPNRMQGTNQVMLTTDHQCYWLTCLLHFCHLATLWCTH